MAEKLEISTTTLWMDEEGFVWSTYKDGAIETLESARAHFEAMERVATGIPRGVVIDIRRLKSATREARKFWAQNHGVATPCAVLVSGGVASALGNFWLSVNRPGTPTKLFSSEAEAVEWLRTVVASQR
jgi:hypothetical protein